MLDVVSARSSQGMSSTLTSRWTRSFEPKGSQWSKGSKDPKHCLTRGCGTEGLKVKRDVEQITAAFIPVASNCNLLSKKNPSWRFTASNCFKDGKGRTSNFSAPSIANHICHIRESVMLPWAPFMQLERPKGKAVASRWILVGHMQSV